MQTRRRRRPPPMGRRSHEPRHPIGSARRRWPRAYDGGAPVPPRINRRYRRAFDGGERRAASDRLRRRGRSAMDQIRRNPVRHGLIGLAIAGTAAPLAMTRHQQQAERVNPAHEQMLNYVHAPPLSDAAVSGAWSAAEEEATTRKESAREGKISEKMSQYAELGLSRELAEDIYDIALQEDIDPDMAFGMVRTESEFKNTATSHVGAIGLTQLMPKTADWLQPGVSTGELRNPETNLRIGFKYLRDLIDKYDGNERLALLAYNRGPGTVDRVLERGGDPNNGYVEAVVSGRGMH